MHLLVDSEDGRQSRYSALAELWRQPTDKPCSIRYELLGQRIFFIGVAMLRHLLPCNDGGTRTITKQTKRDNRPLNPNRPSLSGDNSMRQYKIRMTQQQCIRHKASSTDQGSTAGPPSCRAHNDAYRCQQSVEEQVKYLHGSKNVNAMIVTATTISYGGP